MLLHEPRSAGHQRAKLVEILNGTNLSGTWRAKIAQWERLVKDYESQAVAPVDEEIKMAVFEKHICPDDVRDHFCLNAARLTTFDKMKDEVAGVLLALQGRFAASWDSSGPTPMDIGLIGWTGKGKGDKGKKSKGKGDKGKARRRTSLLTRMLARRLTRKRRNAACAGAKGTSRSIATPRRSTRRSRAVSIWLKTAMKKARCWLLVGARHRQ